MWEWFFFAGGHILIVLQYRVFCERNCSCVVFGSCWGLENRIQKVDDEERGSVYIHDGSYIVPIQTW